MITVSNLKKRFGALEVLRGVDANIRPGRVTAVLGPNAAGKTTLIKCILGLVRPDEGRIAIAGHELTQDWTYRGRIGYMSQRPHFPDNLSGREIISLVSRLRGGHDPETFDRLLTEFGVTTEIKKQVRTLSGGTRQKISAVLAFMFDPEILILDEPSAGLDPVASTHLKDRVSRARDEGRAVLLTSHIISEVEEMASHLIFLNEGRVLFDGTVDQMRSETGEARLERAIARRMATEKT